MSTTSKPVRDGYHTIVPSLTIRGAADAIEFYKRAFNAVEICRYATPVGKIMHAEIRMGDSVIMLSEEMPEWGSVSPQALGGCPGLLRINVEDCEAFFEQAVQAGATVLQPLANQFWGDRSGTLVDPFGYRWSIATQVEDVSPEEISRRASTYLYGMD